MMFQLISGDPMLKEKKKKRRKYLHCENIQLPFELFSFRRIDAEWVSSRQRKKK